MLQRLQLRMGCVTGSCTRRAHMQFVGIFVKKTKKSDMHQLRTCSGACNCAWDESHVVARGARMQGVASFLKKRKKKGPHKLRVCCGSYNCARGTSHASAHEAARVRVVGIFFKSEPHWLAACCGRLQLHMDCVARACD